MKSRPAAAPLRLKHADRRAPVVLSLVARETMGSAATNDTEEALLDFNEDDVIAGIVPVPSTIPPAMRDALERMMMLRFVGDSDRLDQWLHAGHPSLSGASPFESLIAGDGAAVMRALLRSGDLARGRRAGSTSPERRQTTLTLLR